MGVRVRPKARESAADKAPARYGLWGWLKQKDNRTVLQFVGAGIVALIGVLTTLGILHQPAPPEAHPVPSATAAPPAPPPPQPVNQSATANGDAATNVSGSSNVVVIRK